MVSAVDCGIAVNPDGVRAMTEGAINFALTAVLTGEITIKDGAVEQSNFHDYQVLRINQAPEVEVHIMPSVEGPSGVGELGAMLVPPLWRMPFSPPRECGCGVCPSILNF